MDSGTPFPTLPTKVMDAIKLLFRKVCSSKHLPGVCNVPSTQKSLFDGIVTSHIHLLNFLLISSGGCYTLTRDDIAQFPTLSFRLAGDFALDYPPDQYLMCTLSFMTVTSLNHSPIYYCQKPGQLGLALQADPSGFGSVLGMNLLRSFTTIYDIGASRVGFASVSGCPSSTDPTMH